MRFKLSKLLYIFLMREIWEMIGAKIANKDDLFSLILSQLVTWPESVKFLLVHRHRQFLFNVEYLELQT